MANIGLGDLWKFDRSVVHLRLNQCDGLKTVVNSQVNNREHKKSITLCSGKTRTENLREHLTTRGLNLLFSC